MTEQRRIREGASGRVFARGAVVISTGGSAVTSASLLGVSERSSLDAREPDHVPPRFNFTSPFYCAKPAGTVDPLAGLELFVGTRLATRRLWPSVRHPFSGDR